MRTILMLPWGNNNGHVAHCVELGRAARSRGWRVVVAQHGDPMHRKLIESSECEPTDYPVELTPADMWDCWASESYLEAAVAADVDMINRVRADVVVHDIRVSTPIAAPIAGVPCASICHEPLLPGFIFPGLGINTTWVRHNDVFNRVLSGHGQELIREDLRELLVRGPVLIPSVPEFDPVPGGTSTAPVYIGPLTPTLPADLDGSSRADAEGIFFYRTVGANARLDEFCDAFGDLGARVMIATGTDRSAAELDRACAGTSFRVRSLWEMPAVWREAAIAVHHGGPGTCLSCVQGGLPAVVLPGDNPERGLYGDKIQSLGLGLSMSNGASLETSWEAAVDSNGKAPAWHAVRDSVERVLKDDSIRRNVADWREKLSRAHVDIGIAALTEAVDTRKATASGRVID